MKKYKYLILILISSVVFSCEEEYLDVVPDNVATIDNAFSDRFNAQKFLFTIYSAIPSPSSTNNPALNGCSKNPRLTSQFMLLPVGVVERVFPRGPVGW